MSKWMSIGFDPDQMDPVTEPDSQDAISGTLDDAVPRQTSGLDQATPSGLGTVSAPDDSSKHWIASAIRHLIVRRRPLGVPERKL